jgi:hypothetical protein
VIAELDEPIVPSGPPRRPADLGPAARAARFAFAVTVFSDDAIHEAALSVRVSQNEQQESIDDQLRECRKFCRRHDFSAHPLEISA